MDLRVLRRKIGWVTSALTTRMSPSIKARDVVASGFFDSIGLYEEVPAKDLDKADSLVEFMGCEEVLTRAFGVLSQGEQQRILIARALMADPQLLVLDEPCIGLDMKSRESFLQSIGRITKVGPTVLYVTHHIEEIVPQFTHVLLLKGGKVFRSGQKRSILNSPNVSEAFGLEVKVEENDARYTLRILS
jgi:iron complex transport system ATP-binding protein